MRRKDRPRPPIVPAQTRGASQQSVHKAYMRLACLELERARYQREREIVKQRLDALDERLRSIDAEQRLLRGQAPAPPSASGDVKVEVAVRDGGLSEPKDNSPRGTGFSFRY